MTFAHLSKTAPKISRLTLILIVLALVLTPILGLATGEPVHAQTAPGPIVRAVLFYSPTCPHCHDVIENDLPPLMEKYGDQLQIIGIDVTVDWGQALYQDAIIIFNIAENNRGVPALIVGDRLLVGAAEIPDIFPGLIEAYLAEGGVDWPAIPRLQAMMAESEAAAAATAAEPTAAATEAQSVAGAAETATNQETATDQETAAPVVATNAESLAAAAGRTWRERFAQDTAGNSLSVVVLMGMLIGLTTVVVPLFRGRKPRPVRGAKARARTPANDSASWLIPLLAVAGLGVAAYLAYIETTQSTAVCGPVGDCNTVQQSSYAQLFGVPIAIFGLAGYLAILVLWAAQRWGGGELPAQAAAGTFLIAVLGVLFSIYLTFLEPFVIGATCIWCLTSAVIMTVLLLISAKPGRSALQGWMGK